MFMFKLWTCTCSPTKQSHEHFCTFPLKRGVPSVLPCGSTAKAHDTHQAPSQAPRCMMVEHQWSDARKTVVTTHKSLFPPCRHVRVANKGLSHQALSQRHIPCKRTLENQTWWSCSFIINIRETAKWYICSKTSRSVPYIPNRVCLLSAQSTVRNTVSAS